MNRRDRIAKSAKIVALTQAEIDYVASYAGESPVMVMLANTVAMARNEIRRINAEYVLEEAADAKTAPPQAMELLRKWKESRKDG